MPAAKPRPKNVKVFRTDRLTSGPYGERLRLAKTADLYAADPKCKHRVYAPMSGGIKCVGCDGWFCY